MLLLTDIRQVFTTKGDPAHVPTAELIEVLHQMEEAPWASIKGEGMTPRRLSGFLSRYGVKSRRVRGGSVVLRGYAREDLWDVWQRYCPIQGDLVADVALVADTRERESLQGDSGILGPYPKPFESAKHAVVLPTNS